MSIIVNNTPSTKRAGTYCVVWFAGSRKYPLVMASAALVSIPSRAYGTSELPSLPVIPMIAGFHTKRPSATVIQVFHVTNHGNSLRTYQSTKVSTSCSLFVIIELTLSIYDWLEA